MVVDLQKISNNLLKNARTGELIAINQLWKDQPCVITFLRRFGCKMCRLGALEISQLAPKLQDNNVKLVGIGLEELGASEFLEKNFFDGGRWLLGCKKIVLELYIDQEKKTYQDLGFERKSYLGILSAVFQWKTWKATQEADRKQISGNLEGDGLQYGGTIVVNKGGTKVLLQFCQQHFAQHVSNADVLKSLGID